MRNSTKSLPIYQHLLFGFQSDAEPEANATTSQDDGFDDFWGDLDACSDEMAEYKRACELVELDAMFHHKTELIGCEARTFVEATAWPDRSPPPTPIARHYVAVVNSMVGYEAGMAPWVKVDAKDCAYLP